MCIFPGLCSRSPLIMTYTVHVTETNYGSATFATKEEAEEWIQEPDYDFVKWTDCLESKFDLEEDN